MPPLPAAKMPPDWRATDPAIVPLPVSVAVAPTVTAVTPSDPVRFNRPPLRFVGPVYVFAVASETVPPATLTPRVPAPSLRPVVVTFIAPGPASVTVFSWALPLLIPPVRFRAFPLLVAACETVNEHAHFLTGQVEFRNKVRLRR
jgi:hypothetical protein